MSEPLVTCCPCCGSENVQPSLEGPLAFIEHGEYDEHRDRFDIEGDCSAWFCSNCGTTFYVLIG